MPAIVHRRDDDATLFDPLPPADDPDAPPGFIPTPIEPDAGLHVPSWIFPSARPAWLEHRDRIARHRPDLDARQLADAATAALIGADMGRGEQHAPPTTPTPPTPATSTPKGVDRE